ncbi:MAG TPA: hypothetical protein VHB77_08705 [Planctomycetaceae bacterium]|nr:hypothetical protein [Planctomycetaceae bacterium]
MEHFFAAASDWVHDNWIKVLLGLGLMALGWVIGRWRHHAEWRRKQFLGRLNVSLNTIHNGTLCIRTLLEKSSSEVFLNAVAADAVTAAARRTTPQNPLLPLHREDYWYYLNSVLNEIAERFADGEMRRNMGLPTTSARYLICLTCECAGEIRMRKVRAMVMQKGLLEKLPEETPKFEASTHSTRWATLKLLAAEYRKNPHQFLEVEICV